MGQFPCPLLFQSVGVVPARSSDQVRTVLRFIWATLGYLAPRSSLLYRLMNALNSSTCSSTCTLFLLSCCDASGQSVTGYLRALRGDIQYKYNYMFFLSSFRFDFGYGLCGLASISAPPFA